MRSRARWPFGPVTLLLHIRVLRRTAVGCQAGTAAGSAVASGACLGSLRNPLIDQIRQGPTHLRAGPVIPRSRSCTRRAVRSARSDEVQNLQRARGMPRCLIVDDHGDTREGYAEFLRALDFEVRTAADGEQLHVILDEWVPDVILMDLQLPRTDGWTLIRELKSAPRTRQIVIVVVSACVMPSEQQAAMDAGSDVFISKPCDPMTIVETLRARFGRR